MSDGNGPVRATPRRAATAAAARRERFLTPFTHLREQVEQAKNGDVYTLYPTLQEQGDSGSVIVDGVPAVSLVANDYLGLSGDPRVADAANSAIERFGVSRCASPLAGGYTELHQTLEKMLADFTGQQDAVVLASGYQANLGAIGGLLRSGDLVVCDLLSHASIVDGVRLVGAELRYFQHNNAEHLDAVLDAVTADRRVLVVVEGVYSADGDIAPLAEICRVAHRHDAFVMVDEAHSLGVVGANGRGATELYDVADAVDVIVGTMSKSIGTVGGFICGDRTIIDIIRHNARSLIFSAALPPPVTAGAVRSLEIMRTEPGRRARLWANTRHLLGDLRAHGFDTLNSETPVIPVLVGDQLRTLMFSRGLARSGVLVCPAIPPMVQPHMSRIRMHVTARHDADAIERVSAALDAVAREVGVPRTGG
jgi:8-amino-7-oxononanoate synthase